MRRHRSPRRSDARQPASPSTTSPSPIRNGHTAVRDASFELGRARSARWSASTAAASRPSSRRSWASCGRRRRGHASAACRSRGAEAQHRRLRAAERGGRLELPGAGRGRRHDGPLRPHEFPAHRHRARTSARSTQALERVGMSDYRKRQIGELSRRAEEARVPRPRAGAGGPDHPARRAVHRRRRQDRGRDHRPAARAARRRAS